MDRDIVLECQCCGKECTEPRSRRPSRSVAKSAKMLEKAICPNCGRLDDFSVKVIHEG